MHTKCHEGAVGDHVAGVGGGRSRKGKVVAFSVAFAVLGKATSTCLRGSELRLLGRRYDVETFEKDRPGAFCNRCSGWGHIEPRFTGASLWCSLREWDHHQCPSRGAGLKRESRAHMACLSAGTAVALTSPRRTCAGLRRLGGWREAGGRLHNHRGNRALRLPHLPRPHLRKSWQRRKGTRWRYRKCIST